MTQRERAEEFVRQVLVEDLKQKVSNRTIREVAMQVLAVTAPVLAQAEQAQKSRKPTEARAA